MMAARTKFIAMGLLFCFIASLMLLTATSVLASDGEEGDGGDLGPSPENGLTVAVGGVIGIYVVLSLILINVLRKRKKQQMKM
jgi:hypothetical protein